MRVLDLMTPALITVRPATPLRDVLVMMLRRHLNDVLVVDNEQRLLGIVTYSDLCRKLLPSQRDLADHEEYMQRPESMEDRVEEIASLTVEHVMTKHIITVSPETELLKAGATMMAHSVKQLPVVHNHKVVGIVSHTDIGWGILTQYPECMKIEASNAFRLTEACQ